MLLTQVLDAGVTNIHRVQFHTTELKKHRDKARALANKAAKGKAKALTEELNMGVGQPLTVKEEGTGWGDWHQNWWGRGHNIISQNSVPGERTNSLGIEGTMAPGEISVNASRALRSRETGRVRPQWETAN
jgi:hypothetical protein